MTKKYRWIWVTLSIIAGIGMIAASILPLFIY